MAGRPEHYPFYGPESGSLPHRTAAALARALAEESDRWFLWTPVAFGAGIGAYFALPAEPTAYAPAAFLCITATLCLAARRATFAWVLSVACLCAALGFANAKFRTWSAAQPVLEDDGFLSLHGWVERTEARLPHGHRITLRVFAAPGERLRTLPARVRFTSRFDEVPATGAAVAVTARLHPPPEPALPGGFDFPRMAYFDGLGAVGFSLGPPKLLQGAPEPPFGIRLRAMIDHVRHGVEKRIHAALPGDAGAVATALITGERGRIPEETLRALRDSGLAHMLAISGMHMAIMAGALYWLVRALAAGVPGLALRYPIKKWAAVIALFGAVFYLGLSGASIATQRAFLMMAIVFTAILMDRPALTLRNVALAACVILAFFPESLLDVSFQMSFAAVTGLVAVYERVERRGGRRAGKTLLGRATGKAGWYLAGIALTTLVASIAVAPFAAYHFHRLAQYGLVGNLATMPLFGLVVMPMALASLVAMPFGLEAAPLTIMAWGVGQIIAIARKVSGWDGATVQVGAMPAISLVALVLGGLWLCLWRKPWRLAGLAIASIGLLTAGGLPKPDILVGRDGELLAVRTDKDALLSATGKTRPGYSLERWLSADGDARDPAAALETKSFRCDELGCIAKARGKTIAFVRHPAALAEDCARADIVVAQIPIRRPCAGAQVHIGRFDLWREGAHALYFDGHAIRVETVAEHRGNRPWSRTVAGKRKKKRTDGSALADVSGEENSEAQ